MTVQGKATMVVRLDTDGGRSHRRIKNYRLVATMISTPQSAESILENEPN